MRSPITAEITGTGTESTVPDDPEAVDAEISVNGDYIGAVTLKPDHAGALDIWGDLEMWANHGVVRHLETCDDRVATIGAIVEAVRKANHA